MDYSAHFHVPINNICYATFISISILDALRIAMLGCPPLLTHLLILFLSVIRQCNDSVDEQNAEPNLIRFVIIVTYLFDSQSCFNFILMIILSLPFEFKGLLLHFRANLDLFPF